MKMYLDLEGKLRNTKLSKSNALLPIFEAVVNSFHALEEVEINTNPSITIDIARESILEGTTIPDIISFEIIDNGIGFNDDNYESFSKSDSLYKASRGGKGLGRFVWLKAFDEAKVISNFKGKDDNGSEQWYKREFSFNSRTFNPDETYLAPVETPRESGTQISLLGFKKSYASEAPKDIETIGYRIIEHCLPFFRKASCPAVLLRDNGKEINLKSYFEEQFGHDNFTKHFNIKGRQFEFSGYRIYGSKHALHKLIFAADKREVTSEKVAKYIPNLQIRIGDPAKGNFVYMGFVEGEYLDSCVSNDRAAFLIPEEINEDNAGLFDDISFSELREKSIGCIRDDLAPLLEGINKEKIAKVEEFIRGEAPVYRPLLYDIHNIVEQMKPICSTSEMDSFLNHQLYISRQALKEESAKYLHANTSAEQESDYNEKFAKFMSRIKQFNESDLAQYVIHRRVILDLLEQALSIKEDDGTYRLEEQVHRIVYPMRTTSDEAPYEQQNLWIIDERLNYHQYLASDKQLKSIPYLNSQSASRPDLVIFDRAIAFHMDRSPITSLVIVEFKKPGRSDFGNEDPISQIYRLIREIRDGSCTDRNGMQINVASDSMPAFGYLICDLSVNLKRIATDKGFLPTPDGMGMYFYNTGLCAYTEIISYEKMLSDARKRNSILFDKLGINRS